jgi:hypothetical protein
MPLSKLIPRNASSERTWEWEEKRRAWYCVELDISYMRYPWPGNEFQVRYKPEEIPENQEAIKEMLERNPVFKEPLMAEKLEDWLHPETKQAQAEERMRIIEQERRDIEEMRLVAAAERMATEQGPRIETREQATGQWFAWIEEGERHRMESPTERMTRERRQEIRNHRRFVKQDERFPGIVRAVRVLPDGPERRDAFRQFWAGLDTAEYEDPIARTREDGLALRAAVLREYEALEDEERRESSRGLEVVHPFVALRQDGRTGFPLRGVRSAGVALLQE